MEKNEEFQLGSFGLLVIYVMVSGPLGTLLTGISLQIIKHTKLATLIIQGQTDKVLVLSCVVASIITIIVSICFWVLVRMFLKPDKLTIEKFKKIAIIALTFSVIGSIVINIYKGYDNIYKDLFTVHVASEIIEDEYYKDSENFKGSGFAEGCKNMDDIRETEKNVTNEWIAHYFITPIIPSCVTLLVAIASLEIFSYITTDRIKQTLTNKNK